MLKEMSVEIIRKCPNMCLHCSSLSSVTCEERMPFDVFHQIVNDASQLGAKLICLSGGEPFLHKDLIRCVQSVEDAGMSCTIYTSGIVLDSQGQVTALPENSLQSLSRLPVRLIFNIEAGLEETYNKIMGTKHCFPILQESVRRTVGLGLSAEANFVPNAVNYREIYQVIALCGQLGISKVNFLRLVLHGRAEMNRPQLELRKEEYVQLQGIFREIQDNSVFPIRIGVPLSSGTGCAKCEAANGKLNIKYNGEVYPCEVFKNGNAGTSLGGFHPDNVYEKRLLDIYQNSPYLRYVREQAKGFLSTVKYEPCIGQYMILHREYQEAGDS